MMIKSLSKLSVLPDDTRVFFGHEYTEKNLRFALTLEPHNASLQAKHAWAEAQMKRRRHHHADDDRLGEGNQSRSCAGTAPSCARRCSSAFPSCRWTTSACSRRRAR